MHPPTTKLAFLYWFILAVTCIGILQWAQSTAAGGVGGLLLVGRDHVASEIIADQIPDIPMTDGLGHDGQLYYLVGLDLTARFIPEQLQKQEPVGYRYRRIAYPATSSLFGTVGGEGLVWGMVIVNTLSVGLAAGATAAIAQLSGISTWVALAVVLNPGVWLSSLLSTADNLALALCLLAVLALLQRRIVALILALAAAALTKEVAIVSAVGIAGYLWRTGQARRSISVVALSALPLALWTAYLALALGPPFESGGSLSLPILGLLRGMMIWPEQRVQEIAFSLLMLAAVFGAAVALLKKTNTLWKWMIAPWLVVALVSSHLIWDLGNNAVRVFSILIVLVVLALLDSRRMRSLSPEITLVGS